MAIALPFALTLAPGIRLPLLKRHAYHGRHDGAVFFVA